MRQSAEEGGTRSRRRAGRWIRLTGHAADRTPRISLVESNGYAKRRRAKTGFNVIEAPVLVRQLQ
jgi:hypothetical protein